MAYTSEHSKTRFFHNSDMSGDVTIHIKETGQEMEVSGADLVEFVVEHLKREAIGRIEQMTTEDFIERICK